MNVLPGGRILKRVWGTVLALSACYLLLLLYVQVNERIMRHRAERLVEEMRQLEVNKSTWDDLQGIRTRWGAWGHYEGECTTKKCDYRIDLEDLPGRQTWQRVIAYLGHSNMAVAMLDIQVEDGLVRMTTFDLWTLVPKGYGARWEREEPQPAGYVPYSSGSYTLIARATSRFPIEHLCCYWPGPVPHPEYVLSKPSGCEGCLAIWTAFEPRASITTKARMTDFNFSRITRWRPCADEEDIMPDAGKEMAEDWPLTQTDG